jgi:hypothetical protein
MTDRGRRLGLGFVVLLALVGCTAASTPTPGGSSPTSSGTAGPVADYGDAPDPSLPTLYASNGAHTLDITRFWLGNLASPSVTAEADANLVDRDALDDGLEAPEGGSGRLGMSFRAVKSASAAGGVVFFNLLVDRGRDGRWSGGDWLAVNQPLSMAPGDSVAIAEVPLAPMFDAWIRATLTDRPVDAAAFPDGWDGTGEFAAGEVEDYYFPTVGPPPTPEPTPSYEPTPTPSPIYEQTPTPAPTYVYTGDFVPACDPASILHGESVFVPIRLTSGQQTPPERFFAIVALDLSDEGAEVVTTPPLDPYWAPWGDGAGFTFKSTAVDPPDRVETWTVWVQLQSRSTTRFLTCTIEVHHVLATATATTPTVQVDPPVLTLGGLTTPVLKLSGAGFTPNGHVTITAVAPGGGRESATISADAGGRVNQNVFIPAAGPAGAWTLLVRDDTTGATAQATFTVK